jgi:hypothetical protein
MIKNNRISLGVDVEDWKFDSTIAATNRMLRDSAVVFNLQLDSSANNTGYFTVRIKNKAGHKFPSGYPSRRAVVQLVVTDAIGDTVFKSGTFTNDYRVVGETPSYEPHHNIISQSDVPQIYELVMGDVNNHFTSVLERSATLLKDNRIPPEGFTTLSNVYDTVLMSNDALADADFNKVNSVEGSGVDLVHYQVPLAGAIGNLTIHARIYYQSVPPKWVSEMFAYSSAEIDSFQAMFNNADQTPLLMASDSLVNMVLSVPQSQAGEGEINVYPTISTDGFVHVKSLAAAGIKHIEIYSSEGKKVNELNLTGYLTGCSIFLPPGKAVYLMKIELETKTFYRKVIRQ